MIFATLTEHGIEIGEAPEEEGPEEEEITDELMMAPWPPSR
jgi:hypothetical protein